MYVCAYFVWVISQDDKLHSSGGDFDVYDWCYSLVELCVAVISAHARVYRQLDFMLIVCRLDCVHM